jgi:hypothetical protein
MPHLVLEVGVGPRIQEDLDDGRVRLATGVHQRRPAVLQEIKQQYKVLHVSTRSTEHPECTVVPYKQTMRRIQRTYLHGTPQATHSYRGLSVDVGLPGHQ